MRNVIILRQSNNVKALNVIILYHHDSALPQHPMHNIRGSSWAHDQWWPTPKLLMALAMGLKGSIRRHMIPCNSFGWIQDLNLGLFSKNLPCIKKIFKKSLSMYNRDAANRPRIPLNLGSRSIWNLLIYSNSSSVPSTFAILTSCHEKHMQIFSYNSSVTVWLTAVWENRIESHSHGCIQPWAQAPHPYCNA